MYKNGILALGIADKESSVISMTNKKISIHSWNRFKTNNLVIVPELIGLSHIFDFNDAKITIQLPDESELTNGRTKDSRLNITGYKEEDGAKKPTHVAVASIDLTCSYRESAIVPEESLIRPPIALDSFDKKQREQFDRTADRYGDTAYKAFEFWIKTIRWKSGNGSVCSPEIHGFESGWSTYLLDDATRHRFWIRPKPLNVYFHDAVTQEQWNNVQETLMDGLKSPAYIDLLFEGQEQFKNKDLRRTIIEIAVACESYLRTKVRLNLPEGLLSSAFKYIEDANIRQVLTYFFPETLDETQKKKLESLSSKLHSLFNARNTILHSGYKDDLTEEECKKYIDAARELILKNLQG